MKMELVRLDQVSKLIAEGRGTPPVPKGGWLRSIRTALGMSVVAAAGRAKVTPMAWTAAERREASGTISLETLRKFLGALGYSLSYVPTAEETLEEKLRKRAFEFAKNETLEIRSTMALEDQAPGKDFTERTIKERAEDIIRSGKWKELWQ